MSFSIADNFEQAPSGIFLLNVYRRGELVEVYEDKNLIVDGARLTMARLLGGDVTNRSITQIGFGIGTSAPAAGNTGLTGAFLKPTDGVSYPASNQVRFAFSLGTTEFNGQPISEFGLFTAGGTLYARKVRAAPLNKDTDLSFSGTWTITF